MGLGIRVYVSADDECGFGTGIDHWAALEIAGGRYRVISLEGKEGSVLSDASFSPDRHGVPGIWLKEVCVCVCVCLCLRLCACVFVYCVSVCMYACTLSTQILHAAPSPTACARAHTQIH